MAGIGDLSLTDVLFSQLDEFKKSSNSSAINKFQDKSRGSGHREASSSNSKNKPDHIQNIQRGKRGHSNGRGTRIRNRNQSVPRPTLSHEGIDGILTRNKYTLRNESTVRYHPNACNYPSTDIHPQNSNGIHNGDLRGEGRRGGNRSRGRGRGRGKFESGKMSRSQSIQSLTSEAEISMRYYHPKRMGYKKLEELIKLPPVDILTHLVNPHFGFHDLLGSSLKPDILILVVTALARACDSELETNKGVLLSMVCQSELLKSIQNHVANMPSDDNKKRNLCISEFTSDLLKLFEVIMNKLPNTASEKLKNIFITIDVALDGLKKHRNIELMEQKDTLEKLTNKLNNMIQDRETKKNKTESRNELMRYNRPPDDFREKSLYPTVEELFGEKTPFIRHNIIEGGYEDVEDYLDIQFRLLREDFIAPLREGLEKLLSNAYTEKKMKLDHVRVYKNVEFGDPKVVNDTVGITVFFDPERRMKINWEYSKRFMFGSLLLFTNDNYKTIVFGTVIDRDIKELRTGKFIAALHETDQKFYGTKYLMLESEVYFEPYKHVMKALQGLDESNFPMKKYIVDVENKPCPPKYLSMYPNFEYTVNGLGIQILNELNWPDADALQLDRSQLAAFQAALTQEFAVIQGPPGTGKTFLGLKIAKVLLGNSAIWNYGSIDLQGTPILVVCYTNHALDQFLEGLVPVTEEIIRVGGQSKSPTMSQFNLRVQRKNHKFKSSKFHLKRELYAEVCTKMKAIQVNQANLEELNKNRGIVSLRTFAAAKNIIKTEQLVCFQSQHYNEDEMLVRWLEAAFNEIDLFREEGDRIDHMKEMEKNEEDEDFYEEIPEAAKTQDFDYEDFDFGNITYNFMYAKDLNELFSQKTSLDAIIQEKVRLKDTSNLRNMNYDYQYLDYSYNSWTTLLQRRQGTEDKAAIEELEHRHDLWRLHPDERWTLYFEWVNRLKFWLRNQTFQLKRAYKHVARRYEEMKTCCDLEILRKSLVVGMTTTSAARNQDLLQILKPKIVIVEEAAEVLESHIVVSLTNKCEHVILIGDHKQLRPATTVYRLAKQYHLDVSLFERMVKNGVPCYCLEYQHRMRQEISSLIKPTIYPNLQNDPCVYSYPPVQGVTKSLFFVTHNVPEEVVEDISSKRNPHEADFLLALCRYLLLQGYSSKEITILTFYKGQMFYMKKKQKMNPILTDILITVVDNYQGEENKIILLSLVRSNEENKIGFLNIENRACVALSRAKEGLFIIGNMDGLTHSSTIWPKVKESLEKQQAVGPHLTLQCSVHPEQLTHVSCSKDFNQVPEGGCLLPCPATLLCGHQCESICHVNNREHKEYKCQKPCQRIPVECPLDHPCPKLCFEDCGFCLVTMDRVLPCGHKIQLPCHVNYKEYECKEKVEVELPLCGHKVKKPCFRELDSFPCPEPCPNRLPCGHSCISQCHPDKDPDHLEYKCVKPCSRKNLHCSLNHECAKKCYEECGLCVFEVTKNLPNCKHSLKMECYKDPKEGVCKRKCEKTMECGHKCQKLCFEECTGCQVKVIKVVPSCNHKVKMKCCEYPDPSKCTKPCERKLPCGHTCTRSCGQLCLDLCFVAVKSPLPLLCGHSINLPCHRAKNVDPASEELLALCQMPCGKTLKCSHNCKGSCGECMQGRIHAPCKEDCGRLLICGHICKVSCATSCPPCLAKCQYRCKHSQCNKKCGVPCSLCKERCGSGCVHQRCTKYCYEPCDIKPCKKPCPKKLNCGHDCIGFCGDRCPPLCRICHKDKLTEFILLGREDEEDARFVYLVDCKHTIEAEGLENWLSQSDKEITLKTCPRCTSRILHTERYMNYVKQNLEDVAKVKAKIFGAWNRLESERKRLKNVFAKQDQSTFKYLEEHSVKFTKFYHLCKFDLESVHPTSRGRRRNFLSKQDLKILNCEIEIFNDLISTVKKVIIDSHVYLKEAIREKIFSKFDLLLSKLKKYHKLLDGQKTSDFNQECKRFLRTVQLAVLENSQNFEYFLQNNASFKYSYEKALKIVHGIHVYTEGNHAELKIIIDSMTKLVGRSSLTDKERKEIVQAVGVLRGAWFKCPNGHPYCIGECGGAMEIANCPECGAQIGGTRHSLLPSNTLATDMDGATSSAYPNMY